MLFGEPAKDPEAEAAAFVDAEKGVEDIKAALDGARQILVERFAEDADTGRRASRLCLGRGGPGFQGDRRARKRTAPNSLTILIIPNR